MIEVVILVEVVGFVADWEGYGGFELEVIVWVNGREGYG